MEKSSMKMAFFVVLLVFAAGELLEAVANAVDIVIWVAILTAWDPGCCCIKLNSGLHVFLVEDRTHPHYTGCDSSGYWTMTAGWQFRRLWKLIVELYKEVRLKSSSISLSLGCYKADASFSSAQFSFRISLENAAPLFALICGKQLSIIVVHQIH
ncbi:hypothetical protein NC653_034351 [Populus alba x Populus x berolinensis]|uniref:Uncharacterized protein n=1 Tax=Populus alba x Populus x berolinensis TaxID=444605 RepID=A0AAD6PXN8_9ROSI|nr:hypothetical protein NC653_034351 [Populus alba x Populus x berolinensis]